MSRGLRRRIADLTCRALQATLPPSLRSWGWVVRCETASIPDDTRALLFALDSLCGLMPRAIASHVLGVFVVSLRDAALNRPRALGAACAIGAVALGIAHLAEAGAPMRHLMVNGGALPIGLTIMALLGRPAGASRRRATAAIIATGGALLATGWFGSGVDGAARWVKIGGLAIQPSLLLLPMMLVVFARTRGALATVGVMAASAAMALQHDPVMAGMIALCLATLAAIDRDRGTAIALAAALAALAATLTRPVTLPAAPYVDGVLDAAFDMSAGAGAAVLAGMALLMVPAIVGWRRDPDHRATYAAFGAVWGAAIMVAAVSNYPTPLVGYGGSAIIGYALSLLALPKRTAMHAGRVDRLCGEPSGSPSGPPLRMALA